MATTNFMTITIDGIDVSKYSEYYVLNHITKKNEPKRSDAFTMTNINDIIQVEVPEIFVKFKYLPIELYRQIFKATRKSEFRVDYYDQDYNIIRSNMFYVKDPTNLKPHAWGGQFYGFKDYELNLVCTMNPISKMQMVILNEDMEKLTPPFLVEKSLSDTTKLQVWVATLFEEERVPSKIEVSFSNDLITMSGDDVVSKEGNVYDVNTTDVYSILDIDISNLKYIGEYIMFLSLKDTNYGNATLSCIIKVVE